MKKHRSLILVVVMLSASMISAWLFLSPNAEKEQAKALQQELLSSIEQGYGVIAADETLAAVTTDFYDDEPVSVEIEAAEETPTPQPFTISGEITGIGILAIDKIGLKLPVTDGVTEAQLKIAVGHVPETAGVGETGNAVIAGHRNYTYGEMFNRLGELVIGDTICYEGIDGQKMEFEVYEILEVLPDDQTAFEQCKDKAIITLYTCTPIKTATHRLLVRAELKL